VLDTYTVLKFLHILAAITWVGSAIFIQAYASIAIRAGDPVEIGTFTKRVAFFGLRLITPSAVLVLVLGVALVVDSAWNFSDTWIELALLGFAITFLTGALFIGPESERISKLIDTEGADSPECRRRIRRIFLVSRLDLVLIVLIVLDMVTKPGA
jgi:uncharacterized membrane protein